MREVILSYLKKKAAVAIKPWGHTPPKSEKLFREKNQQTYDEATFDSIKHYGRSGYWDINNHLRGQRHPNEDEVREIEGHIQDIDRGMDRSPLNEDTILWRGLGVTDLDHPVLKRLYDLNAMSAQLFYYTKVSFKQDKILDLKGFTYSEPTYLSTSLNRRIAENFSAKGGSQNSVIFKIKAPKGTQAIYLPASHKTYQLGMDTPKREDFDGLISETEVLLDRGLKYRVTNVMTLDKNHRHLLVSVTIVK